MFVPISQYYASAPEKSKRLRKKELKPHNAQINEIYRNEEITTQAQTMTESSTQLPIVTTPEYDEISDVTSSASSAIDHSFENSNNNRI